MQINRTVALTVTALFVLALLPWTGHAFDTGAFLNTVDRAFYGGFSPCSWWPFGVVALGVIFLSQSPFLAVPTWTFGMPGRIFLLKLPFFLCDLASARAISRLAEKQGRSVWHGVAFLLSPAVLYTTLIHGTFDAIANVTVVYATLAIIDGNCVAWGVLLGLGAGAKYYPAFFIPLAWMITRRNLGAAEAFKGAAVAVATAAICIVPVYLLNPYSAGSVVNNTTGVTALVSVSPWSLYYIAVAQVPAPFRLPLAAIAASAPSLIGLAMWRRRDTPLSSAEIARSIALAALAVVMLNPGAAPQFYSWIVGPVALFAVLANVRWVLAVTAVFGALATALEFHIERFQTFVSAIYSLAQPIEGPGKEPLTWWTSLLLVSCAVVLAVMLSGGAERRGATGPRLRIIRDDAVFVLVPLLGVSLIAAAALLTMRAKYGYGLLDLGNRVRLNTFVITPVRADPLPHGHGCRIVFDAKQLGIIHVRKALAYSDVSLRLAGRVPAITRVGDVTIADARWLQRRSWTQDIALLAHASDHEVALDPEIVAGRTTIRIETTPCPYGEDPVFVVAFDVPRAERAYFSRR